MLDNPLGTMQINFSTLKQSKIYAFILIVTFIIYGNGINNEYSLDDNIVVDRTDSMVEKGMKAIPKIFKSRYAKDKDQTYDYRPITTTSFAIEKQFFKRLPAFQTIQQKEKKDKLTQANISHFFNVLLYGITCILIFQLLKVLFNQTHVIFPMLITFIFMLHPLHTEVVDNIKSRDEILTLLFMALSLKHYFNFAQKSKIKYLVFAGIFSVLSILSKKNGLAIFAILPLLLYFKGYNYKKVLVLIGTLVLAFVVFKLVKLGVLVEKDTFREVKFFENPLLYSGTFIDRVAVGFYCSLFYLKMLIFPIDLSYYYGYNQIPMATFKDWEVWLSILIFIPLAVYGSIQYIKRKPIGLGILLWLGLMLVVSNVLFPIVGIVAERFTYTFSLGFCIVMAVVLLKIFKIAPSKEQSVVKLPTSFIATILIIGVLYGGRTIARNSAWHDYFTTYVTDVDVVTESAKAHSLVANSLYSKYVNAPLTPEKQQAVKDIVFHFERAIEIDSTYTVCYSNLGSTYIQIIGDNEKGIYYCKKALELNSDYLEATLNVASGYVRSNRPDSAFPYFIRLIEIDPNNLSSYNSLNQYLKKSNKVEQGIVALVELSKSVEEPKFIYTDIANLYAQDPAKVGYSLMYFEKAFEEDPTDQIICNHLITLYARFGKTEKVNYYKTKLGK